MAEVRFLMVTLNIFSHTREKTIKHRLSLFFSWVFDNSYDPINPQWQTIHQITEIVNKTGYSTYKLLF